MTDIDKARGALGYSKIISEGAIFYQNSENLIPTIWTSDDQVVDKLTIELMCEQMKLPVQLFNKMCFGDQTSSETEEYKN